MGLRESVRVTGLMDRQVVAMPVVGLRLGGRGGAVQPNVPMRPIITRRRGV